MTHLNPNPTTPARPPRGSLRRGPALAAAAVAAALTVGGCGAAQGLAGLEPAPAETTTGAPMTEEQATAVAERVLGTASRARAARGAEADALRKQALTGAALSMAAAGSQQPAGTPGDAVNRPAEPQVVALSAGRSWPRAMVVSTEEDSVRKLHLLTAPDARTSFRVSASATVRSGEVAFGPVEDGAAVVTEGAEGQAAPGTVLQQYADALRYPTPKTATVVATDDQFAGQVRSKVAAQAKALGELAKVAEVHSVDTSKTVSMELADGTLLVFGLMVRTDAVAKSSKAQTLTYAGRTVTTSATLTTYESMVFTVPTTGKASLLAVDEQQIATRIK